MLQCPFSGTVSLRMLQVSVPQYPEVGQSVELLCQFELQGEKLYTVSWYKDFNELYRFVPRGSPKQHVYWIDGIKVNVSIRAQPIVRNIASGLKVGSWSLITSCNLPPPHNTTSVATLYILFIRDQVVKVKNNVIVG